MIFRPVLELWIWESLTIPPWYFTVLKTTSSTTSIHFIRWLLFGSLCTQIALIEFNLKFKKKTLTQVKVVFILITGSCAARLSHWFGCIFHSLPSSRYCALLQKQLTNTDFQGSLEDEELCLSFGIVQLMPCGEVVQGV